jgi:hypothetical protein
MDHSEEVFAKKLVAYLLLGEEVLAEFSSGCLGKSDCTELVDGETTIHQELDVCLGWNKLLLGGCCGIAEHTEGWRSQSAVGVD